MQCHISVCADCKLCTEENLVVEEPVVEGTGVIGITALYSETITPEGSDEFIITLAHEDGKYNRISI